MVTKFGYLAKVDAEIERVQDFIAEASETIRIAQVRLTELLSHRREAREFDRAGFIGRAGRQLVLPELVSRPAEAISHEEPPSGLITIRKKANHHGPGERDYAAERARTAALKAARERGEAPPPTERKKRRSDAGVRRPPLHETRNEVAARRERVLDVFKRAPTAVLTPSEVIDELRHKGDDTRSVYNDLAILRDRGDLAQSQLGEPYTLVRK